VCLSVSWLVCHNREPCKTAAPIEMLFGVWTWVGPKNHLLDGGPDPTCIGAVLTVKTLSARQMAG